MLVFTRSAVAELVAAAERSARRRATHNLHFTLDDPVQRFFNALHPGTYVRPHRHLEMDRWELFLAIAGSARVLIFEPDGRVAEARTLGATPEVVAVEVPPQAWHTVCALEPGTVLFEVKPGPYHPESDKQWAVWAPPEGGDGAPSFERWFREAGVGDRPPLHPES